MSVRRLWAICNCGYRGQIGEFRPHCSACGSSNGATLEWEQLTHAAPTLTVVEYYPDGRVRRVQGAESVPA
jgi:hypothetical protein